MNYPIETGKKSNLKRINKFLAKDFKEDLKPSKNKKKETNFKTIFSNFKYYLKS